MSETKIIEWPTSKSGFWWVVDVTDGSVTPLHEGQGETSEQRKQDCEQWLRTPRPSYYRVFHGKQHIADTTTYDEAWTIVHKASYGASVDWLMKYEGWQIVPHFGAREATP